MPSIVSSVFLLSAATLLFEITLTRLFSVTQWYHFAFVSVSVALLGIGGSGSFLAILPSGWKRSAKGGLVPLVLLFSLSCIGSYLVINYLPFDSFRIAWDRAQIVYLLIYYISLSIPFFFAALYVAILLAAFPAHVGSIYGANLAGSACGCLAVIPALSLTGAQGAIVLSALLGTLALSALAWPRGKWLAASLLLSTLLLLALIHSPKALDIRISPYKALSQALLYPGAKVLLTKWNAFSRIDVIESGGMRSAVGLSFAYEQPPPPQLGLAIDGDDISPISKAAATPSEFLSSLPSAIVYQLRPNPSRVLILEPRGGLDVLMALRFGAQRVTVAEANPLIVDVVGRYFADYAGNIYGDKRVTAVAEDGRSYVHRSEEKFDIVQVALTDSFRPVFAGSYGLSENYLLTSEAFQDYYQHLSPEGLLVVSRWLQIPPSEELRTFSLVVVALNNLGIADPAAHLLAFRTWSTVTILAKKSPLETTEIERVKRFCNDLKYDLIYYPGINLAETNRFNILPGNVHYYTFLALLSDSTRAQLYQSYPYDISPSTDDKPFFFHFFKWRQTWAILQNLGKMWQPFGGSGYLLLVALLVLATTVSGLMILLPLFLLKKGGEPLPHRRWTFAYFSLIGVGYLFIEIPLMQQFILFLGQPTYSFSAVLAALLLFSGIGSLLSARFKPGTMFLLPLLGFIYPWLLAQMFELTLGQGLAIRFTLSLLALAPLGFLMGLPFPSGLGIVHKIDAGLVPWAWGVNGFASVIASILSAMIAVSFGFSTVIRLASLSYLGATLLLSLITQPEARRPP
ncbi:MAG: hypothetical protein M1136_02195 [Chloroflexi bacterium]|nr:hypothetical protein [Chloroflexota bacterium]MCL5074449.1 hypothetical protein [Chloroflexota bacterium]